MLKRIYIFLGLIIGILPAYAQQISIEFGPNQIPIETYFTISVRLKGAALKQASPFPEIEGFQKSSRSTKKITLKSANNLLEEVHTQNYAALNEGTFVVKPFSLTINGTVVKSPGITIQVGAAADETAAAPSPVTAPATKNGKSFLDLETSKKRIYTGEGVYVALYFYLTSAENGQLQFYDFLKQLPELFRKLKQPNSWEEVFEQTEIRPDTVEVNKVSYLRYKLYEVIYYPFNTQNLVFPALDLKMIKYTPAADATFADEKRQAEIKVFTTEAELVQVRALPPHPLREVVPVGRYRLDEAIDRTQLRTNKSVNYSFAIIGEGNIRALPAPSFPARPALEIYPPQIKENVFSAAPAHFGFQTVYVCDHSQSTGGISSPE